jgi:hypothetical protein
MSDQEQAIDRQETNQEILIKSRKWTLLGLLVAGCQPSACDSE